MKTQILNNLDQYFFKQLSAHPLPPYYVTQWSRDCDMCESTSVRVHLTYIDLCKSYSAYIEGLEWAEGPSSWEILDAPTGQAFLDEYEGGRHSRDRAMEAFENGRGNCLNV